MVARNDEALNWFVKVSTTPKLSRFKAWHNALPRTSQLRAMRRLGLDVTVFEAGNRGGKTEAVLNLAMAHVLGRDHPYTVAFCNRNGIDPKTIPVGPGRVWIVAIKHAASIEYHRERMAALVPEDDWREFRNRFALKDAVLKINVPGYAEPAEVLFKSCGDGRDGLQGAECRMIVMDEEPPYECWEECAFRIDDEEPLLLLLSCVWKKGRTKLYRELVENGEEPYVVRHVLNNLDNNALSVGSRDQLRRKMAALDPKTRATRQYGTVQELTDTVYEVFSEDLHVVKPFEIQPNWERGRVMDWGYTNPCVVGWWAVDGDDRIVIYREHRRAQRLAKWHAQQVVKLSGDESYQVGLADPSAPEQRATFREYGIRLAKADNTLDDGILAVIEALEPGGDGRPGIVIFDTCRGIIREMSTGYRRNPKTGKPIPDHDHGPDIIRYIVNHYRNKRGGVPRLDSSGLERSSQWTGLR